MAILGKNDAITVCVVCCSVYTKSKDKCTECGKELHNVKIDHINIDLTKSKFEMSGKIVD
jgi:hypothetical protein